MRDAGARHHAGAVQGFRSGREPDRHDKETPDVTTWLRFFSGDGRSRADSSAPRQSALKAAQSYEDALGRSPSICWLAAILTYCSSIMPCRLSGISVIQAARETSPRLAVVLVTGYAQGEVLRDRLERVPALEEAIQNPELAAAIAQRSS